MFDKKKLMILAGIVIFFIILGTMVYFWLNKGEVSPEIVKTNQSRSLPGGGLPSGGDEPTGNKQPDKPVTMVTQADRDKTEMQNLARFFIEMLGSYSSDAKFQNVIDLKPIMTFKMQSWADSFIVRNLENFENQDERITTSVFKSEILSYESRYARVLFETRREKIENGETEIYNQDAEVKLVKIGDEWLVDSVEWK